MKTMPKKNLLSRFAGLFAKSDIGQRNSYNYQSESNLRGCNSFCKVNHNFSIFCSALTPQYQQNIARIKLPVNANGSLVANIAPIQTTTKLAQTAEKTLSWARENLKEYSTIETVTNRDWSFNYA